MSSELWWVLKPVGADTSGELWGHQTFALGVSWPATGNRMDRQLSINLSYLKMAVLKTKNRKTVTSGPKKFGERKFSGYTWDEFTREDIFSVMSSPDVALFGRVGAVLFEHLLSQDLDVEHLFGHAGGQVLSEHLLGQELGTGHQTPNVGTGPATDNRVDEKISLRFNLFFKMAALMLKGEYVVPGAKCPTDIGKERIVKLHMKTTHKKKRNCGVIPPDMYSDWGDGSCSDTSSWVNIRTRQRRKMACAWNWSHNGLPLKHRLSFRRLKKLRPKNTRAQKTQDYIVLHRVCIQNTCLKMS